MALSLSLPSFLARRRRVVQRPPTSLSWYATLALFGGCFVIWEVVSRLELLDPFIISRPSLIASAWTTQVERGLFMRDLLATLKEFGIGYGLAVVVGIVLGFAAGWYRRLRYSLEPLMWFFYNAPLIAFFPLLIVWFGVGTPTIVALSFILAFFPIYLNTLAGVTLISPVLIDCARSFGGGTFSIFVHIALPATVPAVVAGLRLGIGRALVGVVVGELIGGSAGFGYRMAYAANHVNATLYFVAFLATTVIGFVMTDILKRLEDRLHRYRTA